MAGEREGRRGREGSEGCSSLPYGMQLKKQFLMEFKDLRFGAYLSHMGWGSHVDIGHVHPEMMLEIWTKDRRLWRSVIGCHMTSKISARFIYLFILHIWNSR